MILVIGLNEVKGKTLMDPSGQYKAVVTYRHYESWIACMPGDSSGKSGFITIYDQKGTSYGKIPVHMISQVSDLRWTENGAWIPAYCEWDFKRGIYRYWNDSQTRETVKQAN